jgi:hypothetical protein
VLSRIRLIEALVLLLHITSISAGSFIQSLKQMFCPFLQYKGLIAGTPSLGIGMGFGASE